VEQTAYVNPYSGTGFFTFFIQLFLRAGSFLSGSLPVSELATDEIQILVIGGVSISTALVGCFLVLRRMTMLANSLSHTILLGIVVAFMVTSTGLIGESAAQDHLNIHALLIAAALTGLVTAFLTELLVKTVKLQEDASTGLVFTTMFAVGIILVTILTRSSHVGTEVVMGNADALHVDDIQLVFVVLFMNCLLISLFFKEYKMTTFDPGLSRTLGISTGFFNYLLMTQVSATAIGAFRAVGVLLVLAFITGPVLAARLLTDHLKKMLFLSASIGCLCTIVGVAFARHLLSVHDIALSTGGVVVCVIALFYTLTVFYVRVCKKRIRKEFTYLD
jgi:manganese/zinc/iron transport system permease protein